MHKWTGACSIPRRCGGSYQDFHLAETGPRATQRTHDALDDSLCMVSTGSHLGHRHVGRVGDKGATEYDCTSLLCWRRLRRYTIVILCYKNGHYAGEGCDGTNQAHSDQQSPRRGGAARCSKALLRPTRLSEKGAAQAIVDLQSKRQINNKQTRTQTVSMHADRSQTLAHVPWRQGTRRFLCPARKSLRTAYSWDCMHTNDRST